MFDNNSQQEETSNSPFGTMMGKILIRTVVIAGRALKVDPDRIAEIIATPGKTEEYHKKVIDAMAERDDLNENLEDAVQEIKERREED